MAWYWIALIVGGLVVPWVVSGGQILTGFSEGGLQTGLGTWSGIALVTTPVILLLTWIFTLIFTFFIG